MSIAPSIRIAPMRHARRSGVVALTLAGGLLAIPAATAQDGTGGVDAGEPAVARAAEAGLQRMRVQFSQSTQPAIVAPAEIDPRTGAPVDTASSRATPLPRAGAATGSSATRSVPLPDADIGRIADQAWAMPLGHASVLLRVNGFTVLTDPNFLRRGERARLFAGIGWPRRDDPAADLATLPAIDLVLVTSLREDRFDRTVRRHLPRNVPIVAPASARAALASWGFSQVYALSEDRPLRFDKGGAWLRVQGTPTRPGPPLVSALLPDALGGLLAFGHGDRVDRTVWLSGGTRANDAFADTLRARVGGVDLALIEIGADATPAWTRTTMDGAAAGRLRARIEPRQAAVLVVDDHDRGPRRADDPAPVASASTAPVTLLPLPRGAVLHLDRPARLAAAGATTLR